MKINKRISVKKDYYCWVIELKIPKDKDHYFSKEETGDFNIQKYYYPSLSLCLVSLVDRHLQGGEIKDIKECIKAIKQAKNEILKAIAKEEKND